MLLYVSKGGSESETSLRERIGHNPSIEVAQAFMNTVFLEQFITDFAPRQCCGNWRRAHSLRLRVSSTGTTKAA